MREIEFRGKQLDGEWVYGSYVKNYNSEYIVMPSKEFLDCAGIIIKILSGTIGQYTGLQDSTKWKQLTANEQEEWCKTIYIDEKGREFHNHQNTWNGKKIFEGDRVMMFSNLYGQPNTIRIVTYEQASCSFHTKSTVQPHTYGYFSMNRCEVTGNIHDKENT